MDEITLKRTGHAPVQFQGELLARSDGSRRRGKEQTQYHVLGLYRAEAGGYVASVEYHTCWQGEEGRSDVLGADSGPALAKKLSAFDAAAAVTGFPPGRPGDQISAKRERVLADVRDRYAAQVSEVLEAAGISADAAELTAPARGTPTARDLGRYRWLLADALASIELTEGEAALICDANNGMGTFDLYDEAPGGHEWRSWRFNVEDSIRLDGTDEKWGVDAKALLAKLADMTPVQLCAVADAVEKFWARCEEPTDKLLREVGLVRDRKGES